MPSVDEDDLESYGSLGTRRWPPTIAAARSISLRSRRATACGACRRRRLIDPVTFHQDAVRALGGCSAPERALSGYGTRPRQRRITPGGARTQHTPPALLSARAGIARAGIARTHRRSREKGVGSRFGSAQHLGGPLSAQAPRPANRVTLIVTAFTDLSGEGFMLHGLKRPTRFRRSCTACVPAGRAGATLTTLTSAAERSTLSLHQGNVGDFDESQRVGREVIEQHGRLDILVNNAGVTVDKPVWKMSADDSHKVLGVNLFGTLLHQQAGDRAHDRARLGPEPLHLVGHGRDRQHRPGQLLGLRICL